MSSFIPRCKFLYQTCWFEQHATHYLPLMSMIAYCLMRSPPIRCSDSRAFSAICFTKKTLMTLKHHFRYYTHYILHGLRSIIKLRAFHFRLIRFRMQRYAARDTFGMLSPMLIFNTAAKSNFTPSIGRYQASRATPFSNAKTVTLRR